jgi:hypothetical protein
MNLETARFTMPQATIISPEDNVAAAFRTPRIIRSRHGFGTWNVSVVLRS